MFKFDNEMPWYTRFKLLRVSKELTQEVLAKEIGASVSSVIRWEKGSNVPFRIMREKISAVLDTTVADLFGDSPQIKVEKEINFED